jgi:hypothetical protein
LGDFSPQFLTVDFRIALHLLNGPEYYVAFKHSQPVHFSVLHFFRVEVHTIN